MREFNLEKVEVEGEFHKSSQYYLDREFYSVEDILNIIRTKKLVVDEVIDRKDKEFVIINGRRCKITSQRLEQFSKSVTCAKCGISGSFFSLERHKSDRDPHLNLYHKGKNSKFVMITKDHIIPRSKGGKDWMSNYQTMCKPCNEKKVIK